MNIPDWRMAWDAMWSYAAIAVTAILLIGIVCKLAIFTWLNLAETWKGKKE